jgi:hypothetical protein
VRYLQAVPGAVARNYLDRLERRIDPMKAYR